jgi:hypothetical protein
LCSIAEISVIVHGARRGTRLGRRPKRRARPSRGEKMRPPAQILGDWQGIVKKLPQAQGMLTEVMSGLGR